MKIPDHHEDSRVSLLPAAILLSLLLFGSCSSSDRLLASTGVRQKTYYQQTDLLLTELHYPLTDNTNLDDLLREKILGKYRAFRKKLDEDSIGLLNRGSTFTYRATFDALRSPDLRIISFILYETWETEVNDGVPGTPDVVEKRPPVAVTPDEIQIGNLNKEGTEGPESTRSSGGRNRTSEAEVFIYSLRFDSVVDFLDVIEEPLSVFEGLAASCLRRLNEFVGAGNFYSQGVQPDREHLSMLSFGKSGIQVSFPPGQVMSPDQGVINILVPWAEAIPYDPWQFGIIRSFRPLGYRSRKKKAEAAESAAYLKGVKDQP
ncbi:hypothetical protein P0082_02560 [Candidatus Haliotispira prima]|uniref:DUF3298 domain-containing protein n=1 Tax=Candidatus Haliotispira prima TaxID=3034016 RepID=A0ABY8MIB5_9SPIO|nr:hypothetical protein P0082_02560 [Candidatus Haliotispira prima]